MTDVRIEVYGRAVDDPVTWGLIKKFLVMGLDGQRLPFATDCAVKYCGTELGYEVWRVVLTGLTEWRAEEVRTECSRYHWSQVRCEVVE